MADVVAFPTKAVRDWIIIERELNNVLSTAGLSTDSMTMITERMKAFYETLDAKFDLSGSVSIPGPLSAAQLSAILNAINVDIGRKCSEQLQAFTNRLFMDRLKREIEVHLAPTSSK